MICRTIGATTADGSYCNPSLSPNASPRPRGVTLAVPAGVRRTPTPGRVEAFGTAVGGFVLARAFDRFSVCGHLGCSLEWRRDGGG